MSKPSHEIMCWMTASKHNALCYMSAFRPCMQQVLTTCTLSWDNTGMGQACFAAPYLDALGGYMEIQLMNADVVSIWMTRSSIHHLSACTPNECTFWDTLSTCDLLHHTSAVACALQCIQGHSLCKGQQVQKSWFQDQSCCDCVARQQLVPSSAQTAPGGRQERA